MAVALIYCRPVIQLPSRHLAQEIPHTGLRRRLDGLVKFLERQVRGFLNGIEQGLDPAATAPAGRFSAM